MRAIRTTKIDVEMSGPEAAKLERTVSRVMEQLEKLPKDVYSRLVSLGDVDTLLAFRTTLANSMQGIEDDIR